MNNYPILVEEQFELPIEMTKFKNMKTLMEVRHDMTTEEKAVKETSDRLFARIRKSDDVLREHFSKVKDGDRAYEIRRLLEKAILAEREVK